MEQDQTPSEKQGHPPAQAILHEVRTAENSAAHLLPKLQSMKESNYHLTLLDVGAGSGTISVSFAKLIPNGHVTGVDLNPNILPRARAVAEMAGVKNIEFQQGNVYKLPFADETFDVTFCHQVLIHIGTPWDALREMLRVTKRGGIVAAREGDYESECVWPELPELCKFHKLMAGLMSAGGGTPTAGRQLLSWALKVGVERSQITLSYSTSSYHTPSDKKICSQGLCDQLRGGSLREKALKFGLGTENDLEEMAKAWEEWAKRDDASLAMLHGEILVQK
ncbi:S-adenosyl-L-methionine-dependent methyltransferase [Mytilinidion resinicola]|uniref:S-adenosyl-L-methionine-dependent methyltransferase n=1 Tax=Mytilinidion resinicola TaxID=574789 RepID=A0A6A6Z715_9PEZI|nr:S-adenosyl-L-methionine-dependent methyltransferase [Mytilinidion resinicola]KAF2816891.1 S-adenosyl-L-methionine-dependent methyltransferase [Mytilinidion resinicola]